MNTTTKNGFGLTGVLIAVLIALIVGTGGIYVVKNTDLITKEAQEVFDETADLSPNLSAETLVKEEASATEDWKTYRNEEYGFKFRYPNEWKFNGFSIFDDGKGGKIAEFFPTPNAMIPGIGGNCLNNVFYSIEEIVFREDITVGNLKGERIVEKTSYTDETGGGVWYPNHYCLKGDGENFTVTFYETRLNSDKKLIFDKIISTFKFID